MIGRRALTYITLHAQALLRSPTPAEDDAVFNPNGDGRDGEDRRGSDWENEGKHPRRHGDDSDTELEDTDSEDSDDDAIPALELTKHKADLSFSPSKEISSAGSEVMCAQLHHTSSTIVRWHAHSAYRHHQPPTRMYIKTHINVFEMGHYMQL